MSLLQMPRLAIKTDGGYSATHSAPEAGITAWLRSPHPTLSGLHSLITHSVQLADVCNKLPCCLEFQILGNLSRTTDVLKMPMSATVLELQLVLQETTGVPFWAQEVHALCSPLGASQSLFAFKGHEHMLLGQLKPVLHCDPYTGRILLLVSKSAAAVVPVELSQFLADAMAAQAAASNQLQHTVPGTLHSVGLHRHCHSPATPLSCQGSPAADHPPRKRPKLSAAPVMLTPAEGCPPFEQHSDTDSADAGATACTAAWSALNTLQHSLVAAARCAASQNKQYRQIAECLQQSHVQQHIPRKAHDQVDDREAEKADELLEVAQVLAHLADSNPVTSLTLAHVQQVSYIRRPRSLRIPRPLSDAWCAGFPLFMEADRAAAAAAVQLPALEVTSTTEEQLSCLQHHQGDAECYLADPMQHDQCLVSSLADQRNDVAAGLGVRRRMSRCQVDNDAGTPGAGSNKRATRGSERLEQGSSPLHGSPGIIGTAKHGRRSDSSKKWSEAETEVFIAGVERYGVGQWQRIYDAHPDVFGPRTSVDLKDKWRNLLKTVSTPGLVPRSTRLTEEQKQRILACARMNSKAATGRPSRAVRGGLDAPGSVGDAQDSKL